MHYEDGAIINKPPEQKMPSLFSIFQWNINGLNSQVSKGTLKSFIQTKMPYIFGLTEVRASMDSISKFDLNKDIPDEYSQYYSCCKRRKGYSGVGIFSKVKPLNV